MSGLIKKILLKNDIVWHGSLGKVEINYVVVDNKTSAFEKKSYFEICKKIILEAWGEFPPSFVISRIYNSDILILARHEKKVIGFSQYKFYKDQAYDKYYCSIGLSIMSTNWQGAGLNFRVLARLIFLAFLQNMKITKRLSLEILFETNSVDAIEAILPITKKIYPDPRLMNAQSKKLPVADDETWHRVKHFVSRTGERVFRLQREGSVLVRSYDDMPHLIRKKQEVFINDQFRLFSEKYFRHQQKLGNEIVVRANCSFWKFVQYVYL